MKALEDPTGFASSAELVFKIAALHRLLRAFGPASPATQAAAERLGGLMKGARSHPRPIQLRFSGEELLLNGVAVPIPESQAAAVAELNAGLRRANLGGFDLRSETPVTEISHWLLALAERRSPEGARFQRAGIAAVRLEDPPLELETTPGRSRSGASSSGLARPPSAHDQTPRSRPRTPVSDIARPLGTPERSPASRTGSGLRAPISGLPSTQGPTTPAPTTGRSPPTKLRDAVEAVIQGAVAFQQVYSDAHDGVEAHHLDLLESGADAIDHVVSRRPDLAVAAHRIRARSVGVLPEDALHAAGTTLIAALTVRAVELRGEAKRTLARAALIAHLPYALADVPPGTEPIPKAYASKLCANAWAQAESKRRNPPNSRTGAVVHPLGAGTAPSDEPDRPPWWVAGWIAALEHRWASAEHPVARVVSVAAAYDILTSRSAGPQAPLTAGPALMALARVSDRSLDEAFLTALTAVLAAHR